jgi:glycogen operon protein
LASRLTGSSDIFDRTGRRPRSSVNFVTAHDGFTLNDLVSYDHKHNEANLEGNQDGHNANYSSNCGVEGPTEDPTIRNLRAQQKRNLLATLLLSQGLPMLLAGDEFSNTQLGNNNAYCQDNEIGWLGWTDVQEDPELVDFVRDLIELRREHPLFRRPHYFKGNATSPDGLKDIMWIDPSGREMVDADWHDPARRHLAALFGGDTGDRFVSLRGYPEYDDTFLMLLNAHDHEIPFIVPSLPNFAGWRLVFDTTRPQRLAPETRFLPNAVFPLRGRTLALLVAE